MTRGQRRAHRIAWLVLGPLVIAALAYALALRADVPPSETPGAEASP